MPPRLFSAETRAVMIFSASPWLKSTNCSMHLKSTTATPIVMSVAVMPRNDAVNAALCCADDDDDVAVFLSLLHAATDTSSVTASTTAMPDRPRTLATTHPPVSVRHAECGALA